MESAEREYKSQPLLTPDQHTFALVQRLSRRFQSVSPGFDLSTKLTALRQLSKPGISDLGLGLMHPRKREIQAKNNTYLPTIGVELEVPGSSVIENYYRIFVNELKIPFYSGMASYFEFSLPYSYAAGTQTLLLHLLTEMGYLPTDNLLNPGKGEPWSNRRRIPNSSNFSLHCNLGIPGIFFGKTLPQSFLKQATTLAMACGLAFSSTDRLDSRKSIRCMSTDREAAASFKNPEVARGGRVEITPLGLGTKPSYRQLYHIQDLGAAFFALQKSQTQGMNLDPTEVYIAELWEEANGFLEELFEKNGLTEDIFNTRRILRPFLAKRDLQSQMHLFLPRLARKIHGAIYENKLDLGLDRIRK